VAEKTRIPLARAEALAAEVVDLLRESCARIEVAGSIRRRRPAVGDVEVVCEPLLAQEIERVDMFTTRVVEVNRLDARCRQLREVGVFADRLDKNGRPAFGSLYKRLSYRDVALDVFSAAASNWGVIMLLRTGPAEFNKALVLKRSEGGWLPRGFFFRGGELWRLPPPYDADLARHAAVVPTPDEASVFAALGYAYVPPEQRSERRPPLLTAVPS